jgi:adenylate cyclase
MHSGPEKLRAFLADLKRRKVYRVAVVYAAVAFVIWQVAEIAVPGLNLPNVVLTAVILLTVIGFPITLVLAWAFDITPEGVRRTGPQPSGTTPARPPGALTDAETKAAPPKSVAVLPFANLNPDPETQWFSDGITEDVITQLSKIGDLKVISRTSAMRYRERGELSLPAIAAELGVATVLEGSVRQAQDRVRIVAQLIDAGTDDHLWAETYDRQLTDIFSIQSDVALHIAAALDARLSADERARIGKEPTRDLEAYELYLKGRHCFYRFTEEGMRKALDYYRQAIEKDPDYALVYADLALAYVALAIGHGAGALQPGEAYLRAKEAVAKALELDSGLGEAHAMLAFVKFAYDLDWAGAEREFERAVELNPGAADTHDYYGLMLSALERYDEAIAAQRRAKELDPLAPFHSSDLASTLLRAGRYDEAMQEAERVIGLEPHYPLGHATLGWAYLKKGMSDEGQAELERAVSLSPGNTILVAQLGQAYAMVGKSGEARGVLGQLEELSRQRYVSPYHMAYVYTGLGEQDEAIDWLERAYEERAGGVYGIKGSFLFTTLRSHPRFTALLRKMNLD